MFVLDGIVYAGEPTADLKICDAHVVNDLSMLVSFSTGETRLFDAFELSRTPAFAPLNDQKAFEAFEIDHGVLTWLDGQIDIAPEAVYSRSFRYEASA